MTTDVLLINASYQVLSRVAWQRAVTLVVTEVADIHEAHPDKMIHSMHLSIPLPTIIRMRTYVYTPRLQEWAHGVTRGRILLRDKRTCGYCGLRGDTIDHIIPKSRGGADSWDNLITSCAPCNNTKADRTPVQAGMKLLWVPRAPSAQDADQERVWLTLSEAV